MMAYSFVCRRSRITNKNCLPWLQQSTIPLSSSSSPPPSLPSLCKWWKCKTEPKYVLLQSVHFCRLENSVSYPVHVMPSIQLMCVWMENPVCVFSLPHPLFLSRSIILTPPTPKNCLWMCEKHWYNSDASATNVLCEPTEGKQTVKWRHNVPTFSLSSFQHQLMNDTIC